MSKLITYCDSVEDVVCWFEDRAAYFTERAAELTGKSQYPITEKIRLATLNELRGMATAYSDAASTLCSTLEHINQA
jgi:hypothetical protein